MTDPTETWHEAMATQSTSARLLQLQGDLAACQQDLTAALDLKAAWYEAAQENSAALAEARAEAAELRAQLSRRVEQLDRLAREKDTVDRERRRLAAEHEAALSLLNQWRTEGGKP